MSRPKHRDPRRNVIKPEMEGLELRWLLSQAGALAGPRRTRDLLTAEAHRVGGVPSHAPAADSDRWAAHHGDLLGSGATRNAFEARALAREDLGPWGRLRLLARMQAQGDHRFDALYRRLSARFRRWAADRPARAGQLGVAAAPIAPTGPATPAGGAGAAPTAPAPAPVRSTSGSTTSAQGPPTVYEASPLFSTGDGFAWFSICGCGPSVNDVAPPPGGPCCGGPPIPQPAGGFPTRSSPTLMASDASLLTGEYFQDHPIVTYQSQGQARGIDLQFTSLQAIDQPIVSGTWDLETDGTPLAITKISIQFIVAGVSQGGAITITDIPGNDTYLMQLQAVSVAGMATGIDPDEIQITKYFTDGSTKIDTFDGSLMVDDRATSPYGAGWSIGGLQQLTVGTAGSTLMIATGSGAPEEFTSSDGVHYTGDPTDTSTLTYSSTSQTYTRTYHDGTVITFNSGGQETSQADRNGNSTRYAYVASGPAAGALSTITDPVGLITTFSYDASGHVSTVKDPSGRVTTFGFDSSGDLTQITDPDGAVTKYGYAPGPAMISETDPNNHTATVAYDAFGRLSSETLFDGTSKVQLAPAQEVGLVRWGQSGSGMATTVDYMAKATDPDNGNMTLRFDSRGGVTYMADARGGITNYTLNANDWPTAVEDPMGRTTSYQYDPDGDIT